MAMRGDFTKLQQIIRKVERLSDSQHLRSLTDNLAEEAVDLVLECFATETDPYGKAWAPKVFSDGRQVLVGKTTNLKRSWGRRSAVRRSDGRGFRIASSMVYAKWMQGGTGIYGPKKKRIKPINAKCLAFFAEGYITKSSSRSLRKYMGSAFSANPKAAKSSFKREMQSKKGSVVLVNSVAGAPKRRMVPDKGDLPEAWKRAFVETANDWFAKNFRK